MPNKINTHIILISLILVLGFTLRIYRLSEVPSGFFADEASIGYNAYKLLTTGKDEYDISFPVFFQSFGDYRPPLAVYSTIPFISVFGLNDLSTRLPSVFYGLITILAIYFVGKEIRSKSFGLLAAFIVSTIPWLIHYNRTGFEFTIYVTFFTVTILLFLKATRSKSFIMPAFFVAALTLYTYQPARLLIPLLLLGFLLIYRKTYVFHKRETIAGLLTFFILSIPLILSLFNGEGLARFNMVSVFSAKLPLAQSLLRMIHNYLIQLSPSYFIAGEPTFINRHFVGGLTPLLITTLPFLLVGLVHTFLTIKNKKSAQLLMYWFLIYPIAGAVTADAPFTSRSIIGAPLFAILTSLGITITILKCKKFVHGYILTFIITAVIMLNVSFFAKFYFTQYPLYSSNFWGWQYGAKDIVQYFVLQEKNYDEIIMAPEFNAPEIFFKFYAPNDCKKCRVGLPENFYNPHRKQLFAVTPTYLQNNLAYRFEVIKTIFYPNNTIAFQIGEIVQ